jgi:hypothetical protein
MISEYELQVPQSYGCDAPIRSTNAARLGVFHSKFTRDNKGVDSVSNHRDQRTKMSVILLMLEDI